MAFTWTQSITQYTNLERADIQEIRDKADWLDNNIAYCGTYYATNRAGHYITYYSSYQAFCGSNCSKCASCFAKDCVVIMYDGSKRLIQDVRVGEFVLGAYGDKNEVLYLDRPLRGDRILWDIEGLYTTDEHSIMNGNRNGFCYLNLDSWKSDIQQYQPVIDINGNEILLFLDGVRGEFTKVDLLRLGSSVATTDGHKLITKINATHRNDELLFNLVLGGSHTYCVNGIFVGGFVNDLDFDYTGGCKREIEKELFKRLVSCAI